MGGIGDKTTAFLFRDLQAFCQVVKLVAEDCKLVIAADDNFVGVVTFLDDAH